MITTLVVFLLVIVFLAFFIGNNLSNVCSFWFFKTYTDLPVAVLVFIAFASGIVFSLILLSFGKLLKKKTPAENQSERKETQIKMNNKSNSSIFKGTLAKKSLKKKEMQNDDSVLKDENRTENRIKD